MKKVLSLLLSTALLLPAAGVGAHAEEKGASDTPSMSAEIMSAYGGANGVVSMTFDDGIYETAVWLDQMFEKYNLRGSCMMVTSKINETNLQEWKDLFAKGYLEPENHSATHMVMPGTDWSGNARYESCVPNNNETNYVNEIYRSGVQMAMQFGSFPLCFAPSNNTLSEEGTAYLKQYYYAMRKGQRWGSAGFQSLDPTPGSDAKGGWYNLFMMGFAGNEGGTLISGLDRIATEGGWYVTMCHGIGQEDGQGDSTYAKAEPLFAYMSQLQKEGKIWVTTFGDATKYIRERQNTKLSYIQKEGWYQLTLTMAEKTADGLPLPLDTFNHPLTVKLSVPDGYDAVRYTVGTEQGYVTAITDGASHYAYLDVIPNGESVSVEFVKTETSTIDISECGTVTSLGAYDTTSSTISSSSTSKILIKIPVSHSKSVVNANISLQFGGLADTALAIYAVSAESIAKKSKDTLYQDIANTPLSEDILYQATPLAVIPIGAKEATLPLTEYLCTADEEGWLIVESNALPKISIPLIEARVELSMATSNVYCDPSLIDLSHSLTIDDGFTYHVYWKPNSVIQRVTVNERIYEGKALADLPTITHNNTAYTVLSFTVAPKDACTHIPFQIELRLGNGATSVIEPRLSAAEYLHGLLTKEGDNNPALQALVLDLMLYCKTSTELHKTGGDTSVILGDLMAHAHTAPAITEKLIGVTPVTLTSVESASVDYSGEIPTFTFTPGASHSGSTYRFTWQGGTVAESLTVVIDGKTTFLVPIVGYHFFVPLTIEEYDAGGQLITSETYTVGNDFATLKAGKARDVAKYACAFATSLEEYRKQNTNN